MNQGLHSLMGFLSGIGTGQMIDVYSILSQIPYRGLCQLLWLGGLKSLKNHFYSFQRWLSISIGKTTAAIVHMAAELIPESLGIPSYLSAKAINHRFVGFISYCLAEGFVDTLSHSKIKGVNALTAKHIILIALNGNAGQRSIGTNGIWLPQEAMPGGEATVEQLQQIYLTAVQGNQGKILIMDMNEIIFVCQGKFLWQHIVVNKMLGTFGAQLQHNAHRGISVDIGVVPLHIGINSIGKENILVALH